MEYLDKFNRGLELLAQSQTSSELLGLALITIHGALEDYCRHRIASNPKASEQDRSRVQSVKEVQWKQLIDLMKQYENLPEKESRLIIKMNQKRQKVGHGHPYNGTRQDLESYAEYVGGLLQVKTSSTYSFKSSPSVPYLREEVKPKTTNKPNTNEDILSAPSVPITNKPNTNEDVFSAPSVPTTNKPNTNEDVFSAPSVPTPNKPHTSEDIQAPTVSQSSPNPDIISHYQPKKELLKFLFSWFDVYGNGVIYFIIFGLATIIVASPIIGLFSFLKIIKIKEYVAITTYLLMIVIFLSAGHTQVIFLKKFRLKGLKAWLSTNFVGGVILSYMLINHFPSLLYPNTFFNLTTLSIIANKPVNTLNLWLVPTAITGFIIGLLQWFILKQQSTKAFWWILANMVELPLLWLGSITIVTVMNFQYTLIPLLEKTDLITLWLLLLIVWPLLCRCISGITLAYILKNRFTNSTTLIDGKNDELV